MLKKVHAGILIFSILLPLQSFAEHKRRTNVVTRMLNTGSDLATEFVSVAYDFGSQCIIDLTSRAYNAGIAYAYTTGLISVLILHEGGVYCFLGLPSIADNCEWERDLFLCTETSIKTVNFSDFVRPLELEPTEHKYASSAYDVTGSFVITAGTWLAVTAAPFLTMYILQKKIRSHYGLSGLEEVIVDNLKKQV